MLIEVISLLKLNEENQRSYRRVPTTQVITVLLTILLPLFLIYVAYKNNQFVFGCKDGSVPHWIIANILSIFYYIYTFIARCK